MKVLLTGGAGFIGSWTAEALVKAGHDVVVFDNMHSGSPSNLGEVLESITLVRGDVREVGAVRSVIREYRPDAIIHLAAIVGVDEIRDDPLTGYGVNVTGTINLLEEARRSGVEVFIYASSAAVYGDPDRLPVRELDPTRPLSVYGATKLSGEALVNSYGRSYGLRTVSLRYFNVYGPRMRAGPYAGVIRKFVEAVIEGAPITVFGDGEQTRDFIYVEDVARANLAALEAGVSGVYNIGTGKATRIIDLAKAVMGVAGREVPIRYAPPRPGDIRHSYADISKAREELRWSPSVGLEEGLRRTVEYLRSHSLK